MPRAGAGCPSQGRGCPGPAGRGSGGVSTPRQAPTAAAWPAPAPVPACARAAAPPPLTSSAAISPGAGRLQMEGCRALARAHSRSCVGASEGGLYWHSRGRLPCRLRRQQHRAGVQRSSRGALPDVLSQKRGCPWRWRCRAAPPPCWPRASSPCGWRGAWWLAGGGEGGWCALAPAQFFRFALTGGCSSCQVQVLPAEPRPELGAAALVHGCGALRWWRRRPTRV